MLDFGMAQIRRLNAKIEGLESIIASQCRVTEDLRARAEYSDAVAKDAHAENSRLQARLSTCQDRNLALQSQVAKLQQVEKALREENDERRQEGSDALIEIERLKARICDLERDLARQTRGCDKQREIERREIDRLEGERGELRERVSRIETSLSIAQSALDLENLNRERAEERARIAESNARTAQEQAPWSNPSVTDMSNRIRELKGMNAEMLRKLDTQSRHIEALETENKQVTQCLHDANLRAMTEGRIGPNAARYPLRIQELEKDLALVRHALDQETNSRQAAENELRACEADRERLKQRIHADREKLGRHAEERQAVAAAARDQESYRIREEILRRAPSLGETTGMVLSPTSLALRSLVACPKLCDEAPECVHVLAREIGS